MADFKNWKLYGRVILGGSITLIIGSYLTPTINALLKFIPQNTLNNFLGLTPHIVIAYAIGFFIGDQINEKFLKI